MLPCTDRHSVSPNLAFRLTVKSTWTQWRGSRTVIVGIVGGDLPNGFILMLQPLQFFQLLILEFPKVLIKGRELCMILFKFWEVLRTKIFVRVRFLPVIYLDGFVNLKVLWFHLIINRVYWRHNSIRFSLYFGNYPGNMVGFDPLLYHSHHNSQSLFVNSTLQVVANPICLF